MDKELFKQALAEEPASPRFKLSGNVAEQLEECYKIVVKRREIPYSGDANTLGVINKVSKWLTGDYKRCLLLYGSVGSGKTTMAESICKLLGFYGYTILSTSALDLSRTAREDTEKFSYIMNAKMLCIDDMGIEPITVKHYGSEISPFVEVIYHRYKKKIFTVVTSNLVDEDIKDVYGERVADRFKEMFDKIYYTHKSYRR